MKNIFISYQWSDSHKVDAIYNFFQSNFANHVNLRRDRFENSQWDNIDDFMNSISLCDYAILFVSKKYLQSKNCMYEATRLIEDSSYNNKLLAIILEPDEVYGGSEKIIPYIEYWKKEKENYESKNVQYKEYLGEIYDREINIYDSILKNIAKVFSTMQKKINPPYTDSFIALENIIFDEKDKYVECSKIGEILAEEIAKVMKAEKGCLYEVLNYYADDYKVRDLNIYEIIKKDIDILSIDLKVYLCKYLWYKCFVGEPSVDYRYIYILIYLLRDENIEIDFSGFNQDISCFAPSFFDESSSVYSNSNMGALYYLLEQCPHIYDKLSPALKSLLLSGCKKNMSTLIREYYLFTTAKKQINEIILAMLHNKSKKESINKWNWKKFDLIYLCEHRADDIEEMKSFIIELFSNSKSYYESSELWFVIKFLLPRFNAEEKENLLLAIESNPQIHDNRDSKMFFDDYQSITSTTINIIDYPNWKIGIERTK